MKFTVLSSLLVGLAVVTPAIAQTGSPVDRGRAIAEQLCGRCHAIDPSARSEHGKAPAFHIIAGRYPVQQLAEALAEGILVGHDDMPQFALDPPDIDALLTYMASIAAKRPGKAK